jgi:flagellin-like protein
MKKEMSKKAISPVVTTVLLIMLVIIIAIIILLWTMSFMKEAILKEVGGTKKNIELFCSEVGIKPNVGEDGKIGFTNDKNIPIYAVNLKLTSGGSAQTIKINQDLGGMVNPGYNTFLKKSDGSYYNYNDGYDEVKVIPILLGKKKSGSIEEFLCPERTGVVL